MYLQFKIFLNLVFMSTGPQMFSRSFTVLLLVLFTLLICWYVQFIILNNVYSCFCKEWNINCINPCMM
jgi:hypothetical protein